MKPIIYFQDNIGKDFQYYLHTIALFLNKNYGYEIQYIKNDQFIKIGDFEILFLRFYNSNSVIGSQNASENPLILSSTMM